MNQQMALDELIDDDVLDTSHWVHYEIALAAGYIHKGYAFFGLPSQVVKEVLGRKLEDREIYNYDCYLREHWGHSADSICCGSHEIYKRGAFEVKEWVLAVTPEDQLQVYDERAFQMYLYHHLKEKRKGSKSPYNPPEFWRNGIQIGLPYTEIEVNSLISDWENWYDNELLKGR